VTIELRVVTGARAGTRERFDGSVVKVGRHPLSDMRFDAYADLDVSTRHAELHNTNGTWTIRDQQSTNGTFVNGELVEGERRLNDGDVISFGSTGPRVEVHLSGARAVPRTLATSARPRRNTSDRIAAAVHAHTMSLRRGLLAALVLLAAIGGALVWWQRKAAARERELLSLIARSESASEGLARAIAQMRPRDSAFAAELARQYAATKRSVADGRQLATGGAAATDGSIALFSERLQRAARLQSSIMQIDFARVHDLNDPAVAMIASDLDGTFVAGTAFGVTPAGLLVTNRHVTRTESGAPARRVRVLFANTRDWLPAHVVRASERDDLALLQLDVPGTYPVVAGVSRTGALARVGAAVASIGFPHAIDTPMEGTGLHVTARTTTTAGTVSKRLDRVIQIDSYAGKGSSGSPLFDARGEVVGVIYGGAAESAGRIVYAVPAERVAEFLGEDGRAVVP
jgi:S1-C subfamily serine protease